jgi:hypothetical protein
VARIVEASAQGPPVPKEYEAFFCSQGGSPSTAVRIERYRRQERHASKTKWRESTDRFDKGSRKRIP